MTCDNLPRKRLNPAIMDAITGKPVIVTYDYLTMLKENHPENNFCPDAIDHANCT